MGTIPIGPGRVLRNPQRLKCGGGSATGRGAGPVASTSRCSPPRNSHAGLDGTVGSTGAASRVVPPIPGAKARCFFAPGSNPPAVAGSVPAARLFAAANPPFPLRRPCPWRGIASSRPPAVAPLLSASLAYLGEQSNRANSARPTIWLVLLQTALCNHNRFS